PLRSGVFGSVIGVFAGALLALVAEARRPYFYTEEQVATVVGAPLQARVPRIARHHRTNVFAGDRVASEVFRRLRMLVFTERKTAPQNFVLVTSAIPGEGTTTVASNLAAAIGYNGQSVLLVEGDMHDPQFDKQFNIT